MQTYEIAPDESMEMLVRTLSRMVRRDKDLVLVIPAGVNPFAGVESVSTARAMARHGSRERAARPAGLRDGSPRVTTPMARHRMTRRW